MRRPHQFAFGVLASAMDNITVGETGSNATGESGGGGWRVEGGGRSAESAQAGACAATDAGACGAEAVDVIVVGGRLR